MTQVSFNVTLNVTPATIAALLEVAKSIQAALNGVAGSIEPVTTQVVSAAKLEASPAPPIKEAPPEPQPSSADGKQKWTQERIQAMATMVQLGDSWQTILIRINKMPGEPIKSAPSVTTKYYELRRDGKLPVVKMAPAPAPKPALPPKPHDVSYDQARSWAAQRGLVTGHDAMDIDKVNAKRAELGLAVFNVIGRKPR